MNKSFTKMIEIEEEATMLKSAPMLKKSPGEIPKLKRDKIRASSVRHKIINLRKSKLNQGESMTTANRRE